MLPFLSCQAFGGLKKLVALCLIDRLAKQPANPLPKGIGFDARDPGFSSTLKEVRIPRLVDAQACVPQFIM